MRNQIRKGRRLHEEQSLCLVNRLQTDPAVRHLACYQPRTLLPERCEFF